MAADPAEAADALVDDLADLELDEDLVHQATDDDGGSEEETAVQAAPPAPACGDMGRLGLPCLRAYSSW